MVVKVLFDQVARPAEHERNVGARTDRKPDVGLRGIGLEARVDRNGLHALGAKFDEGAAAARGAAVGGVRAPKDERLDFRIGVVDFSGRFVGD